MVRALAAYRIDSRLILHYMLCALIALCTLPQQNLRLVPTETIWVYEHAPSPADGTYLRAWGVDGKSCPAEGADASNFSYSYLKWDLADVPKGAKLISAKLELNNIPDPGFTADGAKNAPLEARSLVKDFDAKTWDYDKVETIHPNPGKSAVFGTGYPATIHPGEPVPFSIDLMAKAGVFERALGAALASSSHRLSLCLTSAMDPSTDGQSSIYKVYGPSEPKADLRPTLVLTVEIAAEGKR